MRPPAPWFAALLLGLAGASTAHGAATDFLPTNTSWNGLSSLDSMARARGSSLELVNAVDWSALPPRAALIIIHPQVPLRMDRIRAFVERGGRLLVADDFGSAAPLLQQFEIQRVSSGTLKAKRVVDGNRHLPVARSGPVAHELNRGVREIATNHPTYFRSPYSTLAGFGRGQQLLVAGKVGRGQLVALSDPSVLINAMLPWAHNKRFASNLLAHLQPTRGQPIYLATGFFTLRGEPGAGQEGGTARKLVKEFNAFLGMFNDYALLSAALRVLAVVLGALTLLGMLLLLPWPRRDLDGHWIRPHGSAPWGLEEEVGRAGKRFRGGAAYPAAVLREEVEELLGDAIDAPGPLSTIRSQWVVNRVEQLAGAEAARSCSRLLVALRKIPQPSQVVESPLLSAVAIKDLDNLYQQSRALLQKLGQDPFPHHTSRSDNAAH